MSASALSYCQKPEKRIKTSKKALPYEMHLNPQLQHTDGSSMCPLPTNNQSALNTNFFHYLEAQTDVNLALFPDYSSQDLLLYFSKAYRTHCVSVFSMFLQDDYDGVLSSLEGFWSSEPTEIIAIFACPEGLRFITSCDTILYDTMVGHHSHRVYTQKRIDQMLKRFEQAYMQRLDAVLETVHPAIKARKIEIATSLQTQLVRIISTDCLAGVLSEMISNNEKRAGFWSECVKIDFQAVRAEASKVVPDLMVLDDVRQFLQEDIKNIPDVEVLTERIAVIVEKYCPSKLLSPFDNGLGGGGKSFVLLWEYFMSLAQNDLTLRNSPLFGTFHLLKVFANSFVVFYLDSRGSRQERDPVSVDILSDSCDGMAGISEYLSRNNHPTVGATVLSKMTSKNGSSFSINDGFFQKDEHSQTQSIDKYMEKLKIRPNSSLASILDL